MNTNEIVQDILDSAAIKIAESLEPPKDKILPGWTPNVVLAAVQITPIIEEAINQATDQLQKELEGVRLDHAVLKGQIESALDLLEPFCGDTNIGLINGINTLHANYSLAHKELGAAIVRCGDLQKELATARESALMEASDICAALAHPSKFYATHKWTKAVDCKHAILAAITTPASECESRWVQIQDSGVYLTACGEVVTVHAKYCARCGKPIAQVKGVL